MNKASAVEQWLQEVAYGEEQDHNEHHGDFNRHGPDIRAFCITRDTPVPQDWFMAWIEIITNLMGDRMLRIKGIVNVEGYAGPIIVQGVQHIFYPFYEMERWPDTDRRTRIVFITRGIDKDSLETSLQKLAVHKEA
jgi:G3E family GTPase